MKRIGWFAAFLLITSLAAEQQNAPPEDPAFEAVSIRPVPPNAPMFMYPQDFTAVLAGGQYRDPRASLRFLVAFAYDVKNLSIQLVGLPDWAMRESFSVSAKPAQGFPLLPPAENTKLVRLMMRKMLAQRFNLRLHTETRQEQVFNLTVGKRGMKIPEVDPPVPPEREGHVNMALGDSGGRMIAKKATMAGLCQVLALFLRRPVVDRTGLRGYYDYDIRWRAPDTPNGRPSESLGAEGIALLISTVQNEFGLQLRKSKGPVEYWVVDHVERPTEN